MRPKYIECSTFTTVVTPHFQQSIRGRQHLLPETSLQALYERMWKVGIEDTCTGFSFGAGFVYYKCKWNVKRLRWELELISFTPGVRFHTRDNDRAVEVTP